MQAILTKPILALTAHALKEERDRCLSSGFNDHLTKPVNPQILRHKVAVLMALLSTSARRSVRVRHHFDVRTPGVLTCRP